MPSGVYSRINGNKGYFKKGHSRKHSEEEKRKIGTSNKLALTGKILSIEHRLKISKSAKGKNKGSKNGNWKGGITHNPYPSEWNSILRWSIRKRDNYICQECERIQGEKEKIFPVHHIDFNKYNCNPQNLITLCSSCHGKTTSTKSMDKWIRYYKEKVQRL